MLLKAVLKSDKKKGSLINQMNKQHSWQPVIYRSRNNSFIEAAAQRWDRRSWLNLFPPKSNNTRGTNIKKQLIIFSSEFKYNLTC